MDYHDDFYRTVLRPVEHTVLSDDDLPGLGVLVYKFGNISPRERKGAQAGDGLEYFPREFFRAGG